MNGPIVFGPPTRYSLGMSTRARLRSLVVLLLPGALAFGVACSASTTAPVGGLDAEPIDAEEDTTLEEDTGPEDTGGVEDTGRRDTGSATDTRPPACIPVGSSTTCKAYYDCCEDAECVSTPTKAPHCCFTRLQTVVCAFNEECCDDYCTAGKCCVPPGKTCSLNSMCCSNYCGSQITDTGDGGVKLTNSVCCVPNGSSCSGANDCCSKSCVSGKCACLPSGAVVPAYGQSLCCSGTYALAEAGVGYRCR